MVNSGARSLLLLLTLAAAAAASDLDHDGLKDSFEQDLLERFRPQFLMAADDCEAAPSEFQKGSATPVPITPNGAIYGQVFRVPPLPQGSGEYIEIHYFHLWARDCGPFGHPLDVEHVAALVRADSAKDPARKFTASYWYAAAHERTMCDAGHGAGASALGSVDSGVRVWISRGKHASFLGMDRCGRACGADVCDSAHILPAGKLINVGEPGQVLNGAVWVESRLWRFRDKMASNFTPMVLAELSDPSAQGIVSLSAGRRAVQAVVAASHSTRQRTGGALFRASENTGQSIGKSAQSVRASLKKAHQSVKAWFEAR